MERWLSVCIAVFGSWALWPLSDRALEVAFYSLGWAVLFCKLLDAVWNSGLLSDCTLPWEIPTVSLFLFILWWFSELILQHLTNKLELYFFLSHCMFCSLNFMFLACIHVAVNSALSLEWLWDLCIQKQPQFIHLAFYYSLFPFSEKIVNYFTTGGFCFNFY